VKPQTSQTADDSSVKTKFNYHWVVLGTLAIVQIIGSSISMAAGIMVTPLNDPDGSFGWSMAVIGGALATFFLVGAIFSPISGWLADRYGTRKVMLLCGVLFASSMFLLGFVTNLWQFFLVFSLMLAITQSIAMGPMIAAVNVWFRNRLGMAAGLLWGAQGLGAGLMASGVAVLLESVGWRATFWSIALIGGVLILLAAAFFRSRPADMGLRAYGVQADEPAEVAWSERLQGVRMKVFNQHIRKTKEFWNLPLIHHLGCTGHAVILIYSVPIAVDKGISLTAAAVILTLISVFSIISRFLAPMFAERFGGKPAMAAALALQGTTVLMLFWASDAWTFYLFGALFGIGFGGEMSAYPVVNRQYFGSGPLSTFYGIEMMGAFLGHALATGLAGLVIYATGSFNPVIVISMGFSFTGMLVVLTLSPSTEVLIPDWEQSLPEEARTAPSPAD
jgi:MFS family permease